jgi:hypothetical protein
MAGRPCIQGLGVARFDVGHVVACIGIGGGAVGRRRIEMITASAEENKEKWLTGEGSPEETTSCVAGTSRHSDECGETSS